MKLKTIHLRNFRGKKVLNMTLNDHLTVISGENGAGKSSILDAISLGLSWTVARIKNPAGRGGGIKPSDIYIDEREAVIDLDLDDVSHIEIQSRRVGGEVRSGAVLHGKLREYSATIQARAEEGKRQNLPIFVHYGVRRAVIDIPLRIRTKSHESIFETYDDWNKGGANFKSFFEWFRNQEDIENEQLRYARGRDLFSPDRELSTVRRALEFFMPNYKQVRVSRRPLRMLIEKGDETLDLAQLSDGEKIYFALIGDLCRRLVLANPAMTDPLLGEGIVLIDEIDLHLHPNWQKEIATRLTEVFPHVQFIVTTHSSLVLNSVPSECLRVLADNEVRQPNHSYGLPISIILKDEMGLTNELPIEVEHLIDQFAKWIDRGELNAAHTAYTELKQLSPQHPELVRMEFFLNRLKKRSEA